MGVVRFFFPCASGFSNCQKPDAQRKGKDEEEKKGVAVAIASVRFTLAGLYAQEDVQCYQILRYRLQPY